MEQEKENTAGNQQQKPPANANPQSLISQSLAEEKTDAKPQQEQAQAADRSVANRPPATEEKPPSSVASVSLSDVQKMIEDGVTKAVDAKAADSETLLKRHEFLATTMKNFPSFITKLAPMTGDEKVLNAWAAQVQKEFRGFFVGELERVGLKQAYFTKTNIGGGDSHGSGGSLTDFAMPSQSQSTPEQKISASLSPPVRPM